MKEVASVVLHNTAVDNVFSSSLSRPLPSTKKFPTVNYVPSLPANGIVPVRSYHPFRSRYLPPSRPTFPRPKRLALPSLRVNIIILVLWLYLPTEITFHSRQYKSFPPIVTVPSVETTHLTVNYRPFPPRKSFPSRKYTQSQISIPSRQETISLPSLPV